MSNHVRNTIGILASAVPITALSTIAFLLERRKRKFT